MNTHIEQLPQRAQTVRSRARLEMIELGGRWCRRLGLPRSTGQVYGLLYLSAQPLSLDDIVQMLGVSKASASTATRQLSAWGLIRQVWVPGERRDYFEVVEDLGGLIRGGYRDFIKPRLESSQRLFDSLLLALEEDAVAGAVSREEFRICAERLRKLCRMQKKLQAAAPLLERLL